MRKLLLSVIGVIGFTSIAQAGFTPTIISTNVLQSGTTFYTSSGTVNGQLTAGTLSINGVSTFKGDPTVTYGNSLRFQTSAGATGVSLTNSLGSGVSSLNIGNITSGLGIGSNTVFFGTPTVQIFGNSGQLGGSFGVMGSSADATATYSGFVGTTSVDASTLWSLPKKDGTNGQAITTDGSAHLGFTTLPTLATILSTTNTWTAAQTHTSSVTISTSVSLGGTGSQVTISSNVVMPGATFYQGIGPTITNLSVSSMTSTLPMSGRKITGLANGTAVSDGGAFGQIKIVQVVSTYTTVAFTTTSSTPQKTKTSMTITPLSASDNVLVVAGGVGNTPPNKVQFFSFFRNSAGLGGSSGIVDAGGDASGIDLSVFVMYADTPSTTSPVTYYVGMCNSDNTSTVQWGSASEYQTLMLIEYQP